jgi:Glycosyl hydrolases family 2, sugar binding domain
MKRILFSLFFIVAIHQVSLCQQISLAGRWKFRLDSANKGESERWYDTKLTDELELPGSCEQRGFGIKNTAREKDRLTRSIKYEGKAWYQKMIDVSESWRGKRLELYLERCHLESTVWLDDKRYDSQNSLSAPHVYDLGIVTPGKHTITICIDNTYKIPIGKWGFALTEDTQGNWNGIIGRIEIRATDPVWIKKVQVYKDHLKVDVGNISGKSQTAIIDNQLFFISDTGAIINLPKKIGCSVWDEFSPKINSLNLSLVTEKFKDTVGVSYGIKDFVGKKGQFVLNGRPTLMRGPVNECIYPLTGYPPMDKKSWLHVLKICKSYGFNFMRFNSWCPPDAAFQAADQLGMLLQVELPFWSMDAPMYGEDTLRDRFLKDELRRIIVEYGNHPSLAFLAMGNESPGPMDELVNMGRKIDGRILYRCADGDTISKGDYAERGTEIGQRGTMGPRTDWDRWNIFPDSLIAKYKKSDLPTMAHEVGQWGSYPDFNQIKKFTGTLRPYNYERFRRSLADHGLSDLDKPFAKASGQLALTIYKEEIEACMRTYPYGGFQIVEARDFPGEGTALIGWLDVFWDSKGNIIPEEFRRFCDSTVCLLEMPKRIYTSQEIFEAKTMIAHYGSADISSPVNWKIQDENEKTMYAGILPPSRITTGKLTETGTIKIRLDRILKPTALTITLSAAGKSNGWRIWVYPLPKPDKQKTVKISYAFDDETRKALASGENVLLFSSPAKGLFHIRSDFGLCFGWLPNWDSTDIQFPPVQKGKNSIPGSFMPAFWSMRLFNQIGTLGILCNPQHPALANFPTASYCDWQWADILGKYTAEQSYLISTDSSAHDWGDVYHRSKAIILNETPAGYRPIVQVIDNYERNYKLGLIFETRVGKGNLLICAADLDTDAATRPAAQQLKASLIKYACGNQFKPTFELPLDFLEKILIN